MALARRRWRPSCSLAPIWTSSRTAKGALDIAYLVNLANPPVFIAALIGAMLIFLFSSLAIRAVGSAAQGMIEEVRRQFKANPGSCGHRRA